MRLSVDPKDPGYIESGLARYVIVYLDDKEVKYTITADEEQGVVILPRRDVNGNMLYDGNGNVDIETMYGRVRISLDTMPPGLRKIFDEQMQAKDPAYQPILPPVISRKVVE